MRQRISIFGAGRVGQALYDLFKNLKYPVVISSSRAGFSYTYAQSEIQEDDLVFITCPSAVISEISHDLSQTKASLIHSSGADSLNILKSTKRGVFYPLQTFSGQNVAWGNIPIFIQGDVKTTQQLVELAKDCGLKYQISTDEERERLHLAAVFANNFTNAIFQASHQVLKSLPIDHLIPLIEETVRNAMAHHPKEAQTGPAIRGDEGTIQKHLEMLSDSPNEAEVYRTLTKYIKEWGK